MIVLKYCICAKESLLLKKSKKKILIYSTFDDYLIAVKFKLKFVASAVSRSMFMIGHKIVNV